MTREAAPSPQAIAARIGIDLPAAARIEHVERMSGQDDAARLVAVMPQGDWEALRARIAEKARQEPDFSADANFHLGPPGTGWQPAAAAGLKTAQLPWADGAEALNIGVSPADAGAIRLFVFWHQL